MRNTFFSGLTSLALLLPAPVAAAANSEVAEPFVASSDSASFDRSLECLTQAIYYEARSQSDDGQRAVAQVVLNRVRHPAYPNSVCGVVYQGSERSTGCQFTFTCDGSMNAAIEPYAWDRARRIAEAALRGSVYRPVGLATNYHTTAIHPYWAPTLVPQVIVGAHIFYRRPGSGTVEAFSQIPTDDSFGAPERPVHFALPRSPRRALQVAMPVMEIPLVERPVVYRAAGQRTSTPRATAAVADDTPRAQPRQAAARSSTPRMVIQSGVRVFRGS